MNKPKRIQRKRTKGWRMPENAVYVGRPGKFGNPFPVEPGFDHAASVRSFRKWLNGGRCGHAERRGKLYQHLGELKGKDLACWCSLESPCHADVLLGLANPLTSEERLSLSIQEFLQKYSASDTKSDDIFEVPLAQLQEWQKREDVAVEALMDMVNQFFFTREDGFLSHSFMSAEEGAISTLEDLGYAEEVEPERYKLNWEKLGDDKA